MPAPDLRATGTSVGANNGVQSYIDVTLPASTQVGDYVVMHLQGGPRSALVLPSGWSLLSTSNAFTHSLLVFRATTAGATVHRFDVNNGSIYPWYALVSVWSGVEQSVAAYDAHSEATSNRTAPAITTLGVDRRLVYFLKSSSSGLAAASGWTLHASSTANQYVASKTQAAAGSTGTVLGVTPNATTVQEIAYAIALVPANQPPSAPTLTSPNGGGTYNASLTASCTSATDPEGSALVYDYELSRDNGATWAALVTGGTTSQTVNVSAVQASAACRVRVRARDPQGLTSAWDSSDAVFTIQHNVAPNSPSPTAPVANVILDQASAFQLAATNNDPDAGDTISSSLWSYRRTDVLPLPAYTTVTQNNGLAYLAMVAGGLVIGDYEWKVRYTDAGGLQSPESGLALFRLRAVPGIPTGLLPVTGSTVGTQTGSLEWAAVAQDEYQVQRVADNAGAINASVVYEDSGAVVSTARTHPLSFPVNNRWEWVRVRVRKDTLWSAWAAVRVFVAWTPPPVPAFTTATAGRDKTVTITNPAPTGSEPALSGNVVWRRELDRTGTPVPGSTRRLARNVPANSTWTDVRTAHRQRYQYMVEAVGTTGVSRESAWAET